MHSKSVYCILLLNIFMKVQNCCQMQNDIFPQYISSKFSDICLDWNVIILINGFSDALPRVNIYDKTSC